MLFKKTLLASAVLALAGYAVTAAAATTVTNNMPVKITIQNACDVSTTAPTTLDFGTQGPLLSTIDQQSTITVTCTNGASYNVGLDGGANSGGNINARKMVNGGNAVSYQLYSDSGRTVVWGDTVGTDTLAQAGTGTTQTIPVYGRVPAQATPPAGVYTDTVKVSVTY